MVSTPRDVVTFLNALFDGRLLSPARLAAMREHLAPAQFPGSPVVANGHGLLVLRYGGGEVEGHLGQIPGHTSVMGRDLASGATFMLVQNSGAADFESFFLAGIHEPVTEILAAARDVVGARAG
jgi:D-alanyl-D-alanine carboxypeptidase